MTTTRPLYAVTLLATDADTGEQVRDTIVHVAGLDSYGIDDVLSFAAENVARRILGTAPEDDCPKFVIAAIRARLGYHHEDTVVCGPAIVSAAARHVADLLIEHYRDELAGDTRARAAA